MSQPAEAPARLVSPSWQAGLTQVEAERRLADRGPLPPVAASRSYPSIVRANVLTVFNVILAGFGVLTLIFGDWRDGLFLAILAANTSIGILQEVRAKRALDRLAVVVAPTATVIRDGAPRTLPVSSVVEGDLIRLQPGDRVVADGRLVDGEGLSLDESILTGESQAVRREPGQELRSGSFAVEGAGDYLATAVGATSYAARLAGEARSFRHPRSPLERSLNRLLLVLVAAMVPLGVLLGYALWERETPTRDAVSTAVAAVVTLIPEGLVLLTSLTFAVGALRMARRGVLAQQLSAIESLASVDVVCLDKTGTLTDGGLRVLELIPAEGVGDAELACALGRYAASARSRNPTLAAIADAHPATPEPAEGEVPFSAHRRWSALRLGGATYLLGAPEALPLGALRERVSPETSAGRRVLALAVTAAPLPGSGPDRPLPPDSTPLGLVVLGERIRQGAPEAIAFLRDQGVALKVLSGDAPATVAAIAAAVGMPAAPAREARDLPAQAGDLARALREVAVVGRVSPEDKRRVVEALRGDGHHVAMVGDGVNDVPALKAAQLAVAPANGTQMARAVADLVLVGGDFGVVPSLIGEGRKTLRNLQRVAKLFVAKSVLAAFLILTIGLTPTSYPFLPRHLTLASALTIGIPAFFLALAPSSGPWKTGGFLREVAAFAVPAGIAAGLGVVSSYLFALNVINLSLTSARTVATTALIAVGLYLVLALEAAGRRRSAWVGALCAVLAALYGLVLAFPSSRDFFALATPSPAILATAAAGAALAVLGLWLTDERFVPGRAVTAPDGGDRELHQR